MEMHIVAMVVCLILLYVLLPFWFIISQDKRENKVRNQPPELWRIDYWNLIDKIRVYNFLKEELKDNNCPVAEEKGK